MRTAPAVASRPAPSAAQRMAASSSDGYWAAKKLYRRKESHHHVKEIRYWKGGGSRRQGWYGVGITGSWDDDSAPFVSNEPLNESEAGVELLSRVEMSSSGSRLVTEVDTETQWDEIHTRARSAHSRGNISMPSEMRMDFCNKLVAWCEKVDELIELYDTNEKDVTKWRNRLAALSAAQIALGLVGGGLIIAGIIATGGLAAIPMAAGAIAIAASSAAAGVAVGAARSVAEVGLENAQRGGEQHGKAVVGGTELLKGAGGVGAKEGLTRGLVAATQAGAASAVGAAAGGGGVAISLVKGGMGAHKAYKVDVGAMRNEIHWNKALANLASAEKFLAKNSTGLDPLLLVMIEQKIKDTQAKISKIAQERWSEESRRMVRERGLAPSEAALKVAAAEKAQIRKDVGKKIDIYSSPLL
ncbi:hypothetical protein [Spirosoma horti]